jgi:hypothetical protein
MPDFDYETYYKRRDSEYTDFIKKTGEMKAFHLSSFIKDEKVEHNSIAEVGTGPGDVLNYFDRFKVKIGMDISLKGLQIQVNSYFKNYLLSHIFVGGSFFVYAKGKFNK